MKKRKFGAGEVALVYAIVGVAWILLSDALAVFVSDDSLALARLQSMKGLIYVGVTAAILYFALEWWRKSIERSDDSWRNDELAEAFPLGLAESGLDGVIRFANLHLARMLMMEQSEIIGMALWDLIPDDTGKKALRVFHDMLISAEPEPAPYNTRVLQKDGGIIEAQVNWRLRKDPSGKTIGLISVISDITERKIAEDALRESEERFRSLSDASVEAIFVSIGGAVIMVNRAAAAMFGYGVDEMIGEKITDFAAPESRGSVLANIKDGYTQPYEAHGLRKDGTIFPVEIIARNIVWMGKKARLSAVRDITTRHAMDEERNRMASALEHSAESIMITDTNDILVYVNPAFERLTGYTRGEVVGRTPRIVKSGLHDAAFYRNIWAKLLSGETWHGRLVNKRKDGRLIEMSVSISPVFGADGKTDGYVSVQHDITQEAMLDKAKEYFTAVTSHELRTPLARMELALALLRRTGGDTDPEKIGAVRNVMEEIYFDFHRIVSMTTFLSSLSVTGANRPIDIVYIFPVVQLCADAAAGMIRREKRSINLDIDIERLPLETSIRGNDEMIKTAVTELLSNAIKYTPDGRKVSITGAVEENHAVITVSDEGIGISKDRQERVFEPYFSLEEPLRHSSGLYKFRGGGIGLGLTAARMIMEHHGGKLEMSSGGENKGTSVSLKFPLAI